MQYSFLFWKIVDNFPWKEDAYSHVLMQNIIYIIARITAYKNVNLDFF